MTPLVQADVTWAADQSARWRTRSYALLLLSVVLVLFVLAEPARYAGPVVTLLLLAVGVVSGVSISRWRHESALQHARILLRERAHGFETEREQMLAEIDSLRTSTRADEA